MLIILTIGLDLVEASLCINNWVNIRKINFSITYLGGWSELVCDLDRRPGAHHKRQDITNGDMNGDLSWIQLLLNTYVNIKPNFNYRFIYKNS